MRSVMERYVVGLLVSLCLMGVGGAVAFATSASKETARADAEIQGIKNRISRFEDTNENAHERIEAKIDRILERMGGK